VRCAFPVARTHTNEIQKMQIQVLTNTCRCRANTHTLTRKRKHRNTCTRLQSLEDNVLRNILQHHSWVCLLISDSIERSHLILFTCSTLFLRLYDSIGTESGKKAEAFCSYTSFESSSSSMKSSNRTFSRPESSDRTEDLALDADARWVVCLNEP
jgi:hypothetical protein